MYERNDGIGEDNILQNQFTAYLLRAIRNRKLQYLQQKAKRQTLEIILEIPISLTAAAQSTEPADDLPIMDQLDNARLQQALRKTKERELYILFARVLQDKPFGEIARELGLKLKTVTSTYYRLIERLREELRGGNR